MSFVVGSENRKEIVKTLLAYPKRQWSCSALEELTKISHATTFRTLQRLQEFGLLKSIKINRKDLLFELVKESFWIKELNRIINLERTTARKIARSFAERIKSKEINAIILYGSTVKDELKPESDIDLLIITKKQNQALEKKIQDKAAEFSSKWNKSLSTTIIDLGAIQKEKESPFIRSVKEKMEVLYGKEPF